MTQGKYKQYYSEESFQEKLQDFAKTAGTQVVYAALLLYYLMKDKKIPLKAKLTITAALGYFILPIDAIPDFIPLAGFGDDLGVLIFALSQINSYITPEMRAKARLQLKQWFNHVDENEIVSLEEKIS